MCFKLDQTFFIPNTDYKKLIHEEIFYLVWAGEGRWDWNTVYNWPIWLRKFYLKQITLIRETKTKNVNETNTTEQTKIKHPF